MDYRITVQMLEIYNETLRDLLADGASPYSVAPRLDILSTQASGCNVPGAVQVRAGAGGFRGADWAWQGGALVGVLLVL